MQNKRTNKKKKKARHVQRCSKIIKQHEVTVINLARFVDCSFKFTVFNF